MARKPSELLTDREAQMMQILWDRGSATAEDVRAALPDEPHDSTVRTLLRVLVNKRYVKTSGRQPTLYQASIGREKIQGRAARSLLKRFFDGSVEALVMRLIEDEQLSAEQLDQLRRSIPGRKRKERDE